MTDIILIIVILLIVGGAGLYIYKAKKRGSGCIGCPYGKTCGGSECSCQKSDKTKNNT